MAPQQLSSENFGKNLEFTRAVHEAFTWRLNRSQCDTVAVTIGDSSAMKSEYWFNASGKAQEIADGDIFLVGFICPLGDRILHGFIEVQHAVLLSRDSSQTPESLSAAENRGNPVPAIATGIALVKDVTVLNHQQRQASVRDRVLLCCRASGLRDVSIRGIENEPTGSQKNQTTNHSHEAEITTVAGMKIKKLVEGPGWDDLPLMRRGSETIADTAGKFSSEQLKFLARPKPTPTGVSRLGLIERAVVLSRRLCLTRGPFESLAPPSNSSLTRA